MGRPKKYQIYYRIKHIDSGQYYAGTKCYWEDHKYIKDIVFNVAGRLYPTERGAIKTISDITNSSYTKFSKMDETEKILYAKPELSALTVVKTKVILKDIE